MKGIQRQYEGNVKDMRCSFNIFINDLLNVAFAINQGNFAAEFGVNSGPQWSVRIVSIR